MDAVGIIRVSRVGGREGESFVSPTEQRERIEAECEREGLTLLRIEDELEVSGGKPLDKRPGLTKALEAVEAGEAQVIVAAYFDRLYRSLEVQAEVGRRVEAAGGKVLTVDAGYVGSGSSSEWLNATMRGMLAEYYRRQSGERSAEAQRSAIERGVPILAFIPAGYLRGEDGRLVIDPVNGPTVAQVFKMRAEGIEMRYLKMFMAEHGIKRSYDSIRRMLMNPLYLGRIQFGEHVKDNAHEPIIDEATWRACQKHKPSPGRPAASPMLLARLQIVRCGSCGRSMASSTQTKRGKPYGYYRCPSTCDCTDKASVSEKIVDRIVTEQVRDALGELRGHASADSQISAAEGQVKAAQEALDSAIRAFDGVDEASARERIIELREARNAAQAERDQLGSRAEAQRVVNAVTDWDSLSYDERRALIKATIERVVVSPATNAGVPNPERVEVHMYGYTPKRKGEITRLRKGLGKSIADAQRALDRAAQSRV